MKEREVLTPIPWLIVQQLMLVLLWRDAQACVPCVRRALRRACVRRALRRACGVDHHPHC